MSKTKGSFPANTKTSFFSGGKAVEKRAVEHKIPEVYEVVQEIGQELFQKMVNEWIDKGYDCIGGIAINSISANPKGWVFTGSNKEIGVLSV